jgi:serine/threonine protein kinase
MGAVYEANDTRLNRQVALKVLPAKMANNPEWFKRFEREAQAVAALNHPNIVTIHFVEDADNVHFIILELVGGKTLDALIPEGGMPIGQFFDIAVPLADAIAAAHKRGIAHRDLKPGNVMVDDEGRVKVLDFGIAKLIEEDIPDDEAATQMGSEALTEEGKIVGTVAYMSPEQAEGKAADPRSDIFSLGILLYEMATGDRPFVGDTKLSILASIVKDDPRPIYERNMEMPRHLARIIKKALEKNLNRRYQSMVELRNDLIELKEEIDAGEPLITGGSLTDPGTLSAYQAAKAKPTASKGLWLGAAGVIVATAAVAWAFFGGDGGGEEAPTGPPPVQVTQLTTSSAVDFGGTISNDGEWFAFTRRTADGRHEIHLQSVGSRSTIRIAEKGASPAFSSDGKQIAFSDEPVLTSNTAIGGGISIMGRTGDSL